MPINNYIQAEVSLSQFRENLECVRRHIGPDTKLCVVLKANAYGHGIDGLWPTAAELADYLAVATIAEAIDLREMGYTGKLLTTMSCGPKAGGFFGALIADAISKNIELAVSNLETAQDIAKLVKSTKGLTKACVHAKIDTGMGRSGCKPNEAADFIKFITTSSELKLAGIFTHYAKADCSDKTHANAQTTTFENLLTNQISKLPEGIIRHAAASGAIADLKNSHFDMVRLGLAAYGYQSDELATPLNVKPILRLTAPVTQIKNLPAGSTCGYGCTKTLTRDSRVAIVPAGYADGINRLLSNRLRVKIEGSCTPPLLGRVSMDQIILDITDIPTAKIGSAAELISNNPASENSVENLAKLCNTIPYEITTSLNPWRIDFNYINQEPEII